MGKGPGRRRSRVPPARAGTRNSVTRAQFNRLVETINDTGALVADLRRELDVQFRRMAQLQAEFDNVRRTWLRRKNGK